MRYIKEHTHKKEKKARVGTDEFIEMIEFGFITNFRFGCECAYEFMPRHTFLKVFVRQYKRFSPKCTTINIFDCDFKHGLIEPVDDF